MVVALILYGVCVSAVLVWCTTSRSPSVNYLPISMTKLDDLRRWRKDLVVVELHRRAIRAIPGALSVRADETGAALALDTAEDHVGPLRHEGSSILQ
jgi:hypothetical protein